MRLAAAGLGWLIALAGAVFGEQVTGKIDKLTSGEVRMTNAPQSYRIFLTEKTTIIKGSPLAVGDWVRVDCDKGDDGKMMARRISQRVTLSGAVMEIHPGMLMVRAASPERRGWTTVHLLRSTIVGSGGGQLSAGQEVQVVGWDLGNGEVDAARVAIYNSDIPVMKLR